MVKKVVKNVVDEEGGVGEGEEGEGTQEPAQEAEAVVAKAQDWRAGLVVGKQPHAPRLCFYGTHGIGKSTLASQFPDPIFISTEDGIGNIDTVSFPQAKVIRDVVANIRMLIKEPHDFKTVVVDTVDWLVSPLIEEDIAASYSEQERGYGKDAMYIAESFREILQGLNKCRIERNMNVVLLAHSQITRFDSPTCDPYDRYEPKLPKRCNAILQEWVDAMMFVGFKVVIKKTDVGFNREVSRGISSGERLIHYVETPAMVAKNRYDCPATTKMTIEEVAKHIPLMGV